VFETRFAKLPEEVFEDVKPRSKDKKKKAKRDRREQTDSSSDEEDDSDSESEVEESDKEKALKVLQQQLAVVSWTFSSPFGTRNFF
jgi:hypothetical protein